jgi:hypothetical protein
MFVEFIYFLAKESLSLCTSIANYILDGSVA